MIPFTRDEGAAREHQAVQASSQRLNRHLAPSAAHSKRKKSPGKPMIQRGTYSIGSLAITKIFLPDDSITYFIRLRLSRRSLQMVLVSPLDSVDPDG